MATESNGAATTRRTDIEKLYHVRFLRPSEGLDRTQKTKSIPFTDDEYIEIDRVLKRTAELFGLDAVRALRLQFVKVVDPKNVATCDSRGRLTKIADDHPLKGTAFAPTSTAYVYNRTIELRDTPRDACYFGVEHGVGPCTVDYDIYDVAQMVSAVVDNHIRGTQSCYPIPSGDENAAFLGEKMAGKRRAYDRVPEFYDDTKRSDKVTDVTVLRQRLRAALQLTP